MTNLQSLPCHSFVSLSFFSVQGFFNINDLSHGLNLAYLCGGGGGGGGGSSPLLTQIP